MARRYPTPPTSTTTRPGCFSIRIPLRRAIIPLVAPPPPCPTPCPDAAGSERLGRKPLLDGHLQTACFRLRRGHLERLPHLLQGLLVATVEVERVRQRVAEKGQPRTRLL